MGRTLDRLVNTNSRTGTAVQRVYGGDAGVLRLGDTGAGANLKYADVAIDGGATAFRHLNDDFSVKTTPMYFGASGFVMVPNYQFVGEGSGAGYLRFQSGWASGSGWIGWYNASGQRLAYVGDSNTNYAVVLENGAAFTVSGGPLQLPGWTTAGRPASPQWAQIGFNTDTSQFEVYRNGGWHTLLTTPGTALRWNEITSAAYVDFTIPTGARGLRIRGSWSPATAASNLTARSSTDGGSSFAAGGSDYTHGFFYAGGGSVVAVADANDSSFRVGPVQNANELQPFELTVTSTDGVGYSTWASRCCGFNTATVDFFGRGFRNSTTAINAVRLLSASGNIRLMRYTVEAF